MSSALWGLDLGGTKIEICCFTLNNNTKEPTIHLRERIPSNTYLGYEELLINIKNLCESSSKKINIELNTIGIGHPGIHDKRNNLIKNSNTIILNGKSLSSDLSIALSSIGVIEIKFENDANCFALAEAVMGSAKLAKSSFGVILGTGIGGGIIIDSKIISGAHGIAGEWGHISLWDEGPACYCGKKGCIESIISGPALENLFEIMTGSKLQLVDIISRASSDISAKTILNRLLYWLGKGLSHVINIFDPDCIILGGGLSNIKELYSKDQKNIWPWVFTDNFSTPILKASLGDSAGVFGAALLNYKEVKNV
jgi:fructokinase